jgi:DMSO/TMAO reductase YedYZ molybdopterin-dependent catalytic subunit
VKRWLLVLALVAAPGLAQQQRESLVSSRVTVSGEVKQALTLTVEDLRKLGGRRGLVEKKGYAGVRLTDVLEEADIRRDARNALRRSYVVATASDGYVAIFSWGELFNTPVGAGVLVAFDRDGQPLRDGEGRIALVSLEDERSGARHVKWLSRIEVKRHPD